MTYGLRACRDHFTLGQGVRAQVHALDDHESRIAENTFGVAKCEPAGGIVQFRGPEYDQFFGHDIHGQFGGQRQFFQPYRYVFAGGGVEVGDGVCACTGRHLLPVGAGRAVLLNF